MLHLFYVWKNFIHIQKKLNKKGQSTKQITKYMISIIVYYGIVIVIHVVYRNVNCKLVINC